MSACSTTTLTLSQLQQLAQNAGFNSPLSAIMANIAMAESGGCPTASNNADNGGTQTSWGLWQISDGTHRILPGWSDPQTNANMAYAKYKSQGLGAWGTYTSGAYKNCVGCGSGPPLSARTQNGTLSSVPIVGSTLASLQQSFTNFAEEVAVFLIALTVIILGVYLLMGNKIGKAVA
jgi:hypothetical protein